MLSKKIFWITAAGYFATGTAFAATVNLKGTAENSPIVGAVHFEEIDGGVRVTAEVKGTPAGKHGFHIHEKGDCSDMGKPAGGHFNPHGSPHGLVTQGMPKHAHAGDMGNIEIGADGTGRIKLVLPDVTLSGGPHDISGKAVILHEKEDDFSQPTGNAGGRIACGVIA